MVNPQFRWSECRCVGRVFSVVAALSIAAVATASAGTSSTPLTVGVIVVRSCTVDARPGNSPSHALRVTCAAGAAEALRVTDSIPHVVTLNF